MQMGSRSPSEDEGEIVERKTKNMTKATTARPDSRDHRINRRASYSSDSSGSSRSSERPYTRKRSRSRSRSPFRHAASQDRKSVRHDSADRQDRRPYSGRYEEDRHRQDRHGSDKSRSKYDDGHNRSGRSDVGSRKRTISPDGYDRRRDAKRGRHESHKSSKHEESGSRSKFNGQLDKVGRLQDGFVSQKSHPSPVSGFPTSKRDQAPDLSRQQLSSNSRDARENYPDRVTKGSSRESTNGAVRGEASNGKTAARHAEVDQQQAFPDKGPEAQPVDEISEIERRRRRREAILAKHKTQSSSLLVQALEQGSEAIATPNSPSVSQTRSVSPSSTPATPKDTSVPGSPASISITNDEDLANRLRTNPATPDGDESSAADYDPMMDLQEDRARHDPILRSAEVSASNYDETKTETHDILMPTSVEANSDESKPEADEFDMFAETADDDMFAPVAAKAVKNETRTVPVSQELDTNLMDNWDDHEGYYRITLHEVLDGRYRVLANLGKGMFSGVVRAEDSQSGRLVAIKVIRNNETMRKAGMKEIGILQNLADADPENKKNVIRLERYFDHRGHLCMVFENLSINLREVLKKFGRDVGINLTAVRSYAHQMFVGLGLLKKCNILHADLKPDNILVDEGRKHLKICDLGSAGDASENDVTPYLVSRFYRAPEIILGMRFDFALDMWSIGCTLYELYTGKILFTGRSNNQMLRMMMECRGKFSIKMLKKAEFAGLHFEDSGVFRSVEKDKITGKDVVRLLNFTSPTRDLKTRLLASAKGLKAEELKELNLFADLLDKCLHLNPERRITPLEALKHPFITRAKAAGHAH